MATSTMAELQMSKPVAALPVGGKRLVRRRVSPQAGRALEILGHAIEYLTDEYVHAGGNFCARDPQVQAIQMLMALNRQVYFECPEVPSLMERCLGLLHLREA